MKKPLLFRRLGALVATAGLVLAGAATAAASDVDVAVVDVTAPTNSVTLAAGTSADITINMRVSGAQAGTATFEVYRDWTLSGGAFTGSNPQEFTVGPRAGGDAATTFSTTGSVSVAAGQGVGTFTLAVGAFDITNSNTSGAKLGAGESGNYLVTVTAPSKVATTTTLTCPASATYTGSALEPCSATVTDGTSWGGTATLAYANNVNTGTATVTAAYAGDSTRLPSSDEKSFEILPATPICTINGYTGIYGGSSHGASGSCTGVTGEALPGLDLGAVYTDVPGGTANWSLPASQNHTSASGTVQIQIDPASPTCAITGYTGIYDGASHGASGSCTGVTGETLPGLDLGAVYTDVPGGTANWGLPASQNHTADSGTVQILISKAQATCDITGGSHIYDGQPHSPSGTCTGVLGEDLSAGLTFGSVTDVPGGLVNWEFEGGTNYEDQSGSVTVAIEAWDLSGFYQPVRMSTDSTLVWNTVKGGSTVPLKFEVFAGSTELTNTSAISTFNVKQVNCEIPSSVEDSVDFTTTGGTSLRYDTTEGQFIQNWQTPKKSGTCYVVTMTTQDGSALTAHFKLK